MSERRKRNVSKTVDTSPVGNVPWPGWQDCKRSSSIVDSQNLYIVESSCGWIKIGRASDVALRIRSLECSCPPSVKLRILAVVDGFGSHEHTLHEEFDAFRGRGEWFSPEIGPAIRWMISNGIELVILQLAKEQTSPEYRARNERFAAMQDQRIAEAAAELERRKRRYMTLVDAAKIAKVFPATIRKWVADGKISGVTERHKVKVLRSSFERFISDGKHVEYATQVRREQQRQEKLDHGTERPAPGTFVWRGKIRRDTTTEARR